MPVIYAGNKDAAPLVVKTFDDSVALTCRRQSARSLEARKLGPARDKIHDLFLEHVMATPG